MQANDTAPTLRAVLFDLDGVLFDTEPQYIAFWRDIFARYLPSVEGGEKDRMAQTLSHLFETFFSGPMEHLRPVVLEALEKFEAGMAFPPVPGAEEFARECASRGLRTAIVTSSGHGKMARLRLARPGFTDRFGVVVDADDVSRGKPFPDCYLEAAGRLGVEPGECAVFEDSLNGLSAATAAGMFRIGIPTTLSPRELAPRCDYILGDFRLVDLAAVEEAFGQWSRHAPIHADNNITT